MTYYPIHPESTLTFFRGFVVMTDRKTRRISLFAPTLCGGGAERVIVTLARGFAERGLKVDLVLAKAEGPYLSEVVSEVRIVDLKSKRVLYSLPGLVRYLCQESPQALLSTLDHANIVAIWAKKFSGVSTRVVVRVPTTVSQACSTARNIRGRLMPLFIHLFYPWAHAMVAVSKGVAEDLVRITGLPREKIHVIYNPIVISELLSKADESLDHPWFLPGEPPVILGVGRLTNAKDFPTLIRAFALVKRERPAKLIILGEGEERLRLEAIIRELNLEGDVDLPGFVENPYKYMKRAAVFVLSSRWEGLPNTLIEAIVLRRPVVSTNCPSGPMEILENGERDKLVEVGDVKGLSQAIIATLNYENPQKLSKTYKQVFNKFSIDRVVSQYLEVLLS